MWVPHYNANTIHKKSYPQEIWIGYNIELAEQVYSPISYPFRIMALSAGVPGENILLFTWHHVHHIGVPKQWDGSYVAVPKQSCCVVELFSYVSLRNKRFRSRKCTKVCLIAKTATTKWKKGEGREEERTSLLSPRSSFLFFALVLTFSTSLLRQLFSLCKHADISK